MFVIVPFHCLQLTVILVTHSYCRVIICQVFRINRAKADVFYSNISKFFISSKFLFIISQHTIKENPSLCYPFPFSHFLTIVFSGFV